MMLLNDNFHYRVELPTRIEMECCVQQWSQQLEPLLEMEEKSSSERISLSDEIAYWRNRSSSLELINEQFNEKLVRQMAVILKTIGSAQSVTYEVLSRKIISACIEAREIDIHLKPLLQPLQELQECDMGEIIQHIRVLLRAVSLIWCTCNYFQRPSKLALLLKKVTREMIERCCTSLDSHSLLACDLNEALEKIASAENIISCFRQHYNDEKLNIDVLAQRLIDGGRGVTGNKAVWDPPEYVIFETVVIFEERLATIRKILHLINRFSRLHRVEMSAMGGRNLTMQVQNICSKFLDLRSPIISGTYGDCFDPNNERFEKYSSHFLASAGNLYEKLASILGQSLSDAPAPINASRMVHYLETILQGPSMQKEIQRSHYRVAALALSDINHCSDLLMKLVAADSPNTVDTVSQMIQIRRRANVHFLACENLGMNSTQARFMKEAYDKLHLSIQMRIERLVEQWILSQTCVVTVDRPLFVLDGESIASGTDDNLAKMLNEYKNLVQLLGSNWIPEGWKEWTALFTLIKMKIKLVDIVVSCTEHVQSSLNSSIESLFQPVLASIRERIAEEGSTATWTWYSDSRQSNETLKDIAATSLKLQESLKIVQLAQRSIIDITSTLPRCPVLHLENTFLPTGQQLDTFLTEAHIKYKLVSKKIVAIVQDAQKTNDNLSIGNWQPFFASIDNEIFSAIVKTILITCNHFIVYTNKRFLYEIRLDISDKGILLEPLLNDGEGGVGIIGQFNHLFDGLLAISGVFTSFSGSFRFSDKIKSHSLISSMRKQLESNLKKTVAVIQKGLTHLDEFSFLWRINKTKFLPIFLQTNCLLNNDFDENSLIGEDDIKLDSENMHILLECIRERIQQLEGHRNRISHILDKIGRVKKMKHIKLDVQLAYAVIPIVV